MADIKTVTQELDDGTHNIEKSYMANDELPETLTIKLLKEKIDELVAELNTIKSALSGD